MPFTSKQLANGVTFLKQHDFHHLWCDFRIPEKWHEEKQVYGIDEFTMYKKNISVLGYEKQQLDDDDCGTNKDMTFPLIKAVFGSCTCQTFAEYIYALMVHVQELDQIESEKWDKEIDIMKAEQDNNDKEVDDWFDEQKNKDKLYEKFEQYVNKG